MTDHVHYIYEHCCPPSVCSRVGERVDVYPHVRNGVAHLSQIQCVESGVDLWLVDRSPRTALDEALRP